VTSVPGAPAAADTGDYIEVGMPFGGKWAYNVSVEPDAHGQYNDATSSHPSVHSTIYSTGYLFGDWAIDLYPTDETGAVKFKVSSNKDMTFAWQQYADGDCGQRVGIKVSVANGPSVTLYYEHLNNAVKTGEITNGMLIGYAKNWGVCNGNKSHVHFELISGDASNRSCWNSYAVGATLTTGDAIGRVESPGYASTRSKCNSTSRSGRLGFATSVYGAFLNDKVSKDDWKRVLGNGDYKWMSLSGDYVAVINSAGVGHVATVSSQSLAAGTIGLVPLPIPSEPGYPAGVKKLVVDKIGNMIAINNCGAAYAWRNIPGEFKWVKMANCGDAIDVDVGNGRFGLVNSCRGVYISDIGYAWSQRKPCGSKAKNVVVGETGRLGMLDSGKTAYLYDEGPGRWVTKGAVGDTIAVALGKDRLAIITSAGAMFATDVKTDVNAGMTRLTADGDALAIAAGSNDRLGVIASSGAAFVRDEITSGGWVQVTNTGDAKALFIG
jgi:hypothetical protein